MTKIYELPNEKMIIADVDEKHHTATVSVYALDDLVIEANKTGQWIPVSEGLPEDGQSVLFCDNDNDIMVGYHVKGRPDTHFSQDGTYEDMKNVRAWMPLPKPYEPQERSDKE